MSRIRHAARIAGGYTLLVLGVAGLFLPLLQGMLLIIAGAAMLGWDLKKMREARDRLGAWALRLVGKERPPGAGAEPPAPGKGGAGSSRNSEST